MLRSEHYSRTASSTEPVTLTETKTQLRIDHTDEDDDLTTKITVARQECESKLGDVSLIDAVCVDYFDEFCDEMELHWQPVGSADVTSITYYDSTGTQQTLAATVYEVGQRHGVAYVRLKYDQSWPSYRGHEDDIAITYTAGYGTAGSDVPPAIRTWIMARVGWLRGNRDGLEFPWNFDALLGPHGRARAIG